MWQKILLQKQFAFFLRFKVEKQSILFIYLLIYSFINLFIYMAWMSIGNNRQIECYKIKQFRIGPVTGPRSAVLARDRRPWANTADRGPITWPIPPNYLINDNFINYIMAYFIFLWSSQFINCVTLHSEKDSAEYPRRWSLTSKNCAVYQCGISVRISDIARHSSVNFWYIYQFTLVFKRARSF